MFVVLLCLVYLLGICPVAGDREAVAVAVAVASIQKIHEEKVCNN